MSGGDRPRRRPRPPAVYAIADLASLPEGVSLPDAAAAMAAAGVRWIQLRAKPRPAASLPDRELHALVAATVDALEGTGAELWIDDRADLAALFPVAGLHLGQDDLPPAAARRIVGDGVWIGRSTHGPEELERAAADPEVDVVAVGPVFATTSKERPDPVVGLDLVRRARRATDKPLVAIGGIDASNAAAVLAAGADSVAVIAAACRAPIGESCRRLLAATAAGPGGAEASTREVP